MSIADPLAERFKAIPAPVQGALYMIAAALGFSIMNILIRLVSAELHPFEIAFFRNFFALLAMMPWLMGAGFKALSTQRFPMHLWRAAIGLLAMITWFMSISMLPLAEAVALNFTVPLFATAGAALILGEVVRARRWSATVVGFLGVLVILRPGLAEELTWPMALPIISAAFMATSVLIVKSLSRSEQPAAVVLYMNLLLTPLSLIPAVFVWSWPSWPALVMMAFVGGFAALSHVALTKAYSIADASAVLPFDYMRLPFIAIFAWFVFGETTDLWTWIGAGIIAGSAIYIGRREAKVARERTVSLAASRAAEGRP
jgi:drug/metabolite transporter (DMT)-like permease